MVQIQSVESILEQAIQFQIFGTDMEFISFEHTSKNDSTATDLSEDLPGTLFFTTKGSKTCKSIVVKAHNDANDYPFKHLAFLGEISFHRRILPHLEQFAVHTVASFFPKFYYGSISSHNQKDIAFLVLERLETYQPGLWDFRHLSLVMKSLGTFHAASYLTKKKDANIFFPQLRRIYELNLAENASPDSKLVELFVDKSDTKEFLKSVFTANEPVSVINLGLFNRNKVVFQTDSQGNPNSVKFTDLFGARYTAPAYDLMTVMYLCVGQDLRDRCWDDAMKLYYDALSEALLKNEDEVYVPKYSEIEQDFKQYSFVSYLTGSVVFPHYSKTSKKLLDDIEEDILKRFFNESEKLIEP